MHGMSMGAGFEGPEPKKKVSHWIAALARVTGHATTLLPKLFRFHSLLHQDIWCTCGQYDWFIFIKKTSCTRGM
jgi:hypothetical protein